MRCIGLLVGILAGRIAAASLSFPWSSTNR